MAGRKKDEKEPAGVFDLGFGGLFKGMSDLLDVVSNLVVTGEELKAEEGIERIGEFEIKDKGKQPLRGVYGFSIRTVAGGGAPRVERFGNIRTTDEGPVVAEVREPLVDLFDEGEEIVIVAEMPGVAEEEIRVEVQDDVLSLETTGERRYAKEILLPSPADAATLKHTYKNGIVELRMRKKQA